MRAASAARRNEIGGDKNGPWYTGATDTQGPGPDSIGAIPGLDASREVAG